MIVSLGTFSLASALNDFTAHGWPPDRRAGAAPRAGGTCMTAHLASAELYDPPRDPPGTALYISLATLHTNYTGWCQNDVNVYAQV
jgi:hypothetical protein